MNQALGSSEDGEGTVAGVQASAADREGYSGPDVTDGEINRS